MKTKSTIVEQINNMKMKGIKFEIMSEEEATSYLQNNTYYFKIKSYAKSFEIKKKDNQYINLDFAYLVELSKLDMYLRNFIMQLALSCEHFLKVQLVRDVTKNKHEDGYNIITLFLKKYPYVCSNIKNKKNNSACADLIYKYEHNWSLWSIIEVLSFGDFIKLFDLYYATYPTRTNQNNKCLLWSLKYIRNAAAHNNCLLNSLRTPYHYTHLQIIDEVVQPAKELVSQMAIINGISKKVRKKKLANPVIHDFIGSLFLFDDICTSSSLKLRTYEELIKLLNKRFKRNKEYFAHDNLILSYYEYVKKTVDYLYDKSI